LRSFRELFQRQHGIGVKVYIHAFCGNGETAGRMMAREIEATGAAIP
jgi:hypothetical protein